MQTNLIQNMMLINYWNKTVFLKIVQYSKTFIHDAEIRVQN